MDVSSIKITDLIPQRSPFILVDKVLSCTITDAITEFVIRENNIFLDDLVLSPAGIIENMAQSCAARMGCINMLRNEPIKLGFIGDIRDCHILRLPFCNETLITHVHIIEDVFNLTLASVVTKVNDEIVSTARIKIALSNLEAKESN